MVGSHSSPEIEDAGETQNMRGWYLTVDFFAN
jgi:hypothetical protein